MITTQNFGLACRVEMKSIGVVQYHHEEGGPKHISVRGTLALLKSTDCCHTVASSVTNMPETPSHQHIVRVSQVQD
jgi:hypothetical protein